MRIGIICYASLGGSGIVATELALALGARGHTAHLVSSDPPFRLPPAPSGVTFHRVDTPGYPLFHESQYLLALATSLVHLVRRERLDIVHAHYAVPHATAAYLARQILAGTGAEPVPRIVTTLHGTDITLVGSDPSYAEAVAFSIDCSDGVTAVSASLKADTYRALSVRSPIAVIPNFLDCTRYRRDPDPALRARLCPPDRFDALVLHASNFRPVKRVGAAVEIFRRLRARVRARLALVGDGPDLEEATRQLSAAGLDQDVVVLGEQHDMVPILSVADLFLLPSSQESFGLAALEAMACGVPVVYPASGGTVELVGDEAGIGVPHPVSWERDEPPGAEALADAVARVLADRTTYAAAARRRAVERFALQPWLDRHAELFEQLVQGRPV